MSCRVPCYNCDCIQTGDTVTVTAGYHRLQTGRVLEIDRPRQRYLLEIGGVDLWFPRRRLQQKTP